MWKNVCYLSNALTWCIHFISVNQLDQFSNNHTIYIYLFIGFYIYTFIIYRILKYMRAGWAYHESPQKTGK